MRFTQDVCYQDTHKMYIQDIQDMQDTHEIPGVTDCQHMGIGIGLPHILNNKKYVLFGFGRFQFENVEHGQLRNIDLVMCIHSRSYI